MVRASNAFACASSRSRSASVLSRAASWAVVSAFTRASFSFTKKTASAPMPAARSVASTQGKGLCRGVLCVALSVMPDMGTMATVFVGAWAATVRTSSARSAGAGDVPRAARRSVMRARSALSSPQTRSRYAARSSASAMPDATVRMVSSLGVTFGALAGSGVADLGLMNGFTVRRNAGSRVK